MQIQTPSTQLTSSAQSAKTPEKAFLMSREKGNLSKEEV